MFDALQSALLPQATADALAAAPGPTGSRRLSCGVVILNAQRELLLCHVTGHDHWDLPKGGIDTDETPLDAALRETWEETGLRLDAAALTEIGRFDYRPRKALHLYATLLPRIDVAAVLHCHSHFHEYASGHRRPEMDGYAWVAFDDVAAHCTPRMSAVLTGSIDLGALLEALLAASALAPAPQNRPC